MAELKANTSVFLNWIRECNSFSAGKFVDFLISNSVVGAIHKEKLSLLRKHPDVFQVFEDRVAMHPRLDTPQSRTQAMLQVSRAWNAQGITAKWHNELCNVSPTFGATPLMSVDRSITTLFGILGCGVHVNGITRINGQLFMWVAQRKNQNAILPGQLDHLVAGAQPADLSVQAIMMKECYEEANIPLQLLRQARPVGMIGYRTNRGQQLLRHVVINYDLDLPESFEPKNNDGKIANFYLWPIETVVKTVVTTRDFKLNTNLSIIDFLIRYGYLLPDDPYYKDIVSGLHDFVVSLPAEGNSALCEQDRTNCGQRCSNECPSRN